ncbi:DUF2922 domain-containing protein [Jeotgalibacillus proteolyticus]|uniref:DUF2922 domain-containing protein n=1 Tax=Jeotgalibacillus proteolyticus TaxID=2082395 RepID=A0A2S5GD02_9BACL|nr:DUF2922 domain-containing protein [Jeotgalibacillus proteolyticus]PPA70795.1 DUF2922 domain-containing protein [Jeotgalibacillus proteolyticus]
MNKSLEIQFQTEEGATSTLSVESPKEPIDPAVVKAAMESIIAGNAFITPSGALTGIKGARVVMRGTEAVELG